MCLAMGIPHPDMLLQALTSRQWRDWIEFTSVEPIGGDREDYRTAFATAGLAACWVEKPKVTDYLIDWWKPAAAKLPLDERLKFAFISHDAYFAGKSHGN